MRMPNELRWLHRPQREGQAQIAGLPFFISSAGGLVVKKTTEGSNMPEHDLQSQLAELRSQLAQDTPLTEEERASLQAIAQDIELRLANQGVVDQNDSLVDGVNLAVERFEVSHPNTAMTLRNIMQTLANMGI
jgi:hypothetical protein